MFIRFHFEIPGNMFLFSRVTSVGSQPRMTHNTARAMSAVGYGVAFMVMLVGMDSYAYSAQSGTEEVDALKSENVRYKEGRVFKL